VAKLVAVDGRESLTPQTITATAGVPRRRFYAHFSGVEDCFLTTFHLYTAEAICRAKQAGKRGLTPAGRVYRATANLCAQVAHNQALASLCFDEIQISGLEGSHQELMADIGRLAEEGLTHIAPTSDLAVEASAGALWGVLQNEVAMGRARQVTHIAPTLAYFILAPAIGASTAIEAMREEHQPT
jgi:AcrR family transcriptional regulator